MDGTAKGTDLYRYLGRIEKKKSDGSQKLTHEVAKSKKKINVAVQELLSEHGREFEMAIEAHQAQVKELAEDRAMILNKIFDETSKFTVRPPLQSTVIPALNLSKNAQNAVRGNIAKLLNLMHDMDSQFHQEFEKSLHRPFFPQNPSIHYLTCTLIDLRANYLHNSTRAEKRAESSSSLSDEDNVFPPASKKSRTTFRLNDDIPWKSLVKRVTYGL